MERVQSAWNAILQRLLLSAHALLSRLQSFWHSLAQSPHQNRIYIAAGAAVVVLLLIIRAFAGRSRGPMTLSLDQSSDVEVPRRRASFNQTSLNLSRHGAITPAWATVTPIDRAPAVRCTHCDATLDSTSSFCPACGYAQPARQTGTARN